MKGGAANVLSGPAGYAVPLVVAGVLVYLVYRALKAPAAAIAAGASAAYTGAQNFDQNVGLGGFDTWVSGLFSSPPSQPPSPNLNPNADMGGPAFGVTSPAAAGW